MSPDEWRTPGSAPKPQTIEYPATDVHPGMRIMHGHRPRTVTEKSIRRPRGGPVEVILWVRVGLVNTHVTLPEGAKVQVVIDPPPAF